MASSVLPSAKASDVQAVRDALAAGGNVHVAAGTYILDEPLVIDKYVNFTMAKDAVFVANWDKWGQDSPLGIAGTGPWDAVVHVVAGADGSVIHGLNIDGGGNRLRGLMVGAFVDTGGGSFQWTGPDNLEVAGLYVKDVGEHGAHISETNNSVFRDMELLRTQLHPATGQGGAIRINRSSNVLIENVHVRQAGGKGIAVTANSSNVTIKDSVVYDTQRDAGDGIYFNNSSDSLVINSRVYDAQGNALKISEQNTGIEVQDSFFNKHDRGVGYSFHLQGGSESMVTQSAFINQRSSVNIRVAHHPGHETTPGGLAEDNTIDGNYLAQHNNSYLNDQGTNTTYINNSESTRPKIAWMNQFGMTGLYMHNLTTGDVHFEGGGFERGVVGETLDQYDSIYGTWSTISNDVTIVDEDTAGFAPFAGTRFVRLQGGANGVDRPQLASSNIDSGSAGHVTQTAFAFRVDEGVLRVRVRGTTELFADFLINDDGTIEGHYGEDLAAGVPGQEGRFIADVTHNVGEWNVAVIEYVLGSTAAYLSINGGESVLIGPRVVSSNLRNINFRNEGDAHLLAYISAIPEPASIALLAGGALLLMRRP